jgi:ribonuclease P protein component
MWFSQTNENSQGARCDQPPPQTGTQTIERVTCRFPKSARILSRNHYLSLRNTGKRSHVSRSVAIHYRLGASPCQKLGITVSRRSGKSHERNRFKRVVREAFRLCRAGLPNDLEIHISPKIPLANLTFHHVVCDLHSFIESVCHAVKP